MLHSDGREAAAGRGVETHRGRSGVVGAGGVHAYGGGGSLVGRLGHRVGGRGGGVLPGRHEATGDGLGALLNDAAGTLMQVLAVLAEAGAPDEVAADGDLAVDGGGG